MTELTERTNAHVSFFHAKRTIVDEKISRNVSLRLVRPACMAGYASYDWIANR